MTKLLLIFGGEGAELVKYGSKLFSCRNEVETENQCSNCVMLQKHREVFIRPSNLELGLLCPFRDGTRQVFCISWDP